MENYSFTVLSQLIGEPITIRDNAENEAQLIIAEVNKGTIDGDEWQSFSVIYNGEENLSVPQGTYLFSHEKIGEVSLFITPNSATEYETIVSQKRVQAI
ncbi:DUF6916 family protein [Colwellia sp. RSH04]|uniref:DUF6916 family protein n=1 Tax=Colwellia sp. RSH04 TaxID=2305464 RepID=UPI000E576B98|nr:hypothetical protein [Colwellia sp. RSH04]RHW77995.1 hypothetical protein D1094_03475 [Colwellia sp. RSH04]